MFANDSSYLMVLFFGSLIVGIHAWGLYKTALPSISNSLGALSGLGVQLSHVAGQRQFITGFVCYLSITQLLYLILSTSSVILGVAMSMVGSNGSVGALSAHPSEINPLTPLFASSVVIAIAEMKPFSQIENAIRRISHGVAGIPRHLRSIKRDIYNITPNSMRISDSMKFLEWSDTNIFDENSGSHSHDSSQLIEKLNECICAIEQLYSWTYGSNQFAHIWSERGELALSAAQSELISNYEVFRVHIYEQKQLESLIGKDDKHSERYRVGLIRIMSDARELRSRYSELLAVLVLNVEDINAARDKDVEFNKLLESVRDHRSDSMGMNTFLGSIFMGFAISTVAFVCYGIGRYVLSDLQSEHVTLDSQSGELLIHGYRTVDYVMNTLGRTLDLALWDSAGLGLVVLLTGVVALNIRRTRRENNQWSATLNGKYPVLQVINIAFLSTLVASLFYFIFLFMRLVVIPAWYANTATVFSSLLEDFGSLFLPYCFIALMAAPCSFALCSIRDAAVQKKPEGSKRVAFATKMVIRVALICGCLNGFILLRMHKLPTISSAIESILLPSLIIFIYLMSYRFLSLKMSSKIRNTAFNETAPLTMNVDVQPEATKPMMPSEKRRVPEPIS